MKISVGRLRQLIREEGLDTLMRNSAGFGGGGLGSGVSGNQTEPLPGLGDTEEDDGKEQQEELEGPGARQQRREQGQLQRR